jgi:hypothetical protein
MRWKKKVARALESWSSELEERDPRAVPDPSPAARAAPFAPATNGSHAHAAFDLAPLERRLAELFREQQSRSSPIDGASEARLALLEARLADVLAGTASAGAKDPLSRAAEPGLRSKAENGAASERRERIAEDQQAKLESLRAELARLIGEFAAERARIATQLSEAAHEQRRDEQRLAALSGEVSTLQDRLAYHATDLERTRRQAQRAQHLASIALVLAGGAFVVAAVRALLAG